MRYDDGWFARGAGPHQRSRPQRGFRTGYDSIYQDRYRGDPSGGRRGGRPAGGGGFRYDYAWRGDQITRRPAGFPPVHWGGVQPREPEYDRGYRPRRGGPGRGHGGFFRGGF